MSEERVHGQRALAQGLGVSVGLVAKLKKKGTLVELEGGWWDLDAARRALVAHRRGEAPAVAAAIAAAPATPGLAPPVTPNQLMDMYPRYAARLEGELVAIAEGGPTDEDLDQVLRTSTNLVEIARTTALKAAKAYAAAPREDTAKTLHAAIDVRRKVENDTLELDHKRGLLIERDAAKACMGALARRFVLACERLAVRIASQHELWLADNAHGALPADERSRVVRAWVAQQTDQARLAETEEAAREEIERLVLAELASRVKAKKREVA